MSRTMRMFVVLAILFGCVGCDQTTKRIVERHLTDGVTISLMHDTVRLERAENAGAFLSLGESLPPYLRGMVFTVGGLLIATAVLAWALVGRTTKLLSAVGAAFVSAGGLSNVIDRLHAGQVVDFLNVGVGPLRTGIFNVADMALMLGLALMFAASMRSGPLRTKGNGHADRR